MKFNLRCVLESFVLFAVLSATQAFAVTTVEQKGLLSRKAVDLSSVACGIYPAMHDVDACVDKIVRRILKDRDVKPERIAEIIREQAAATPVKHPPKFGDTLRTKEQLAQRVLVYKLLDIIDAACAVEPAITDFELCMDNAYHSILSSRDPHSAYFNEKELAEFQRQMSGELQGIGVEIANAPDKAIGVLRVMEGSPAERAGIKDGDRIVAIVNGAERLLVSSFENIGAATMKIKGAPNTSVTLEILRGEADEHVTVTAVRAAIMVPMVKTEVIVLPGDPRTKFAYVRITQFGSNVRKQFVAAVTRIIAAYPDLNGVIFDVRGNPGGDLRQVIEMVDSIVDSPNPLVSIRDNDGVHVYGDDSDEPSPVPQPGDLTKGLACGILIDERSASASEIYAGTLKELGRCATIGKGTWRKGSVQRVLPIRDGTAMKTSEAEYLIGSPTKWTAVQCVGVNPDIDYEAEGTIKHEIEKHECDLEGAIVSGGAFSDPGRVIVPLEAKNPVMYATGLLMVEAVKALDHTKFAELERIKKLLKIKDKPEGETETNSQP